MSASGRAALHAVDEPLLVHVLGRRDARPGCRWRSTTGSASRRSRRSRRSPRCAGPSRPSSTARTPRSRSRRCPRRRAASRPSPRACPAARRGRSRRRGCSPSSPRRPRRRVAPRTRAAGARKLYDFGTGLPPSVIAVSRFTIATSAAESSGAIGANIPVGIGVQLRAEPALEVDVAPEGERDRLTVPASRSRVVVVVARDSGGARRLVGVPAELAASARRARIGARQRDEREGREHDGEPDEHAEDGSAHGRSVGRERSAAVAPSPYAWSGHGTVPPFAARVPMGDPRGGDPARAHHRDRRGRAAHRLGPRVSRVAELHEGELHRSSSSDFHGTVEFANRVVTGLVSLGVILAVLGSLVRMPRRRDLIWLSARPRRRRDRAGAARRARRREAARPAVRDGSLPALGGAARQRDRAAPPRRASRRLAQSTRVRLRADLDGPAPRARGLGRARDRNRRHRRGSALR